MKLAITLHWLIIFFIAWGCARQTSPSGGPKDTIPPVLVKDLTTPKNGTLNYKSQLVQLEFNEAIVLNNPKEQIIITPDVQKNTPSLQGKKNVTLEFDNPSKTPPPTHIYFRAAVQDITEKNPRTQSETCIQHRVVYRLAFIHGRYLRSTSHK